MVMKRMYVASVSLSLFCLAAMGVGPVWGADTETVVAAHPPKSDSTEVYVFGKRKKDIGVAESASEGTVSFARFEDRPLTRPGELVEVVPGMAATQHSGNTKANQYFLRGFNLDHGTDFSVSFDGVPLNLRTHAHGQGYLDLNGIIPEVIETITYKKGPYSAELGDFSNAGGATFQTFVDGTPSYIQMTVGENAYGRVLGVFSHKSDFLAVDLESYRGAYDHPDDLRKIDIIGRLSLDRLGLTNWSLTGLAYDAHTNANDQIPQRAVSEGLIDRLGALDTSDGGRTSRYLLSARRHGDDGVDADLYVQHYTLALYSDFTYFLRDPVNGDQFEQADQRWIYGGSLTRTWSEKVLGFTIKTGAEFRYDDIGKVGLYYTRQRQYLSTVRQDRVNEYSGAVYAEASQTFGPVRVTGGLRLDSIGGDVHSDDPRNSGTAGQTLVSPKLTAAWRVAPDIELYADAGQGFHSNDIRGATITVTPGTDDPADKVNLIAPSQGAEIGGRYSSAFGLTTTVALWVLHLDSELVYQGDGGDTASSAATNRRGVELLMEYSPSPGLDLNFTAAASHARYAGNPDGGSYLPNALDYVVTGGVTARLTPRLTATITGRILGPAPLIEDNSARSEETRSFNGLLDYDFGRFKVKLECLNLLDSHGDEIQYYYTSRLPGEPAEGVNDYHFHAFEPRTFRLTLRVPLA
jgi:hypothetical protein